MYMSMGKGEGEGYSDKLCGGGWGVVISIWGMVGRGWGRYAYGGVGS